MLAVVNNGTSNHSEEQQSQYQIISAFCSSHPASKAHALYYALTYGLSGSTMFFQIISQMAGYSKKSYLTYNVCVWIFSTTSVRNISHPNKNSV